MKTVSRQRGAVSVEASIGAIVFLTLIGFLVDYGLLVHRRALLFDVTLKTVQEVTRDPVASASFEGLVERAKELFEEHAKRLISGRAAELEIEKITYRCDSKALFIKSQWTTSCAFCFADHFEKKMHSESLSILESPGTIFDTDDKTCVLSDPRG